MQPSAEVGNRELFRWMFAFLKPVKLRAGLACLYLSLWIGLEILAVWQTARVIDQIKLLQFNAGRPDVGFVAWVLSSDPSAQRLRHIVLLLAGFVALMGGLVYLREVANVKLSMHMVFYIREAVYDKLQRVGFAFHDAISTGELINRSLTDLQNVRAFLNSALLITLEILLIFFGYITVLLIRSPWVALLALMPLPFWIHYVLRFSRKVQPALRAVMEAGDKNVSIITENIAGVHVVKAFATEGQEIAKYDANCNEFFARVMKRIGLFANFQPVIRSIAMVSHLTLFLAGGVLIIKGKLDAGDILMLGAAMGAILNRLQQVAVINDQYQNAVVSARRLYEVLRAEARVAERPQPQALPKGRGSVVFEHVTFGYDPAKPVLRDVSFEVPGGSVVAIVGPTGAGKTTLASLIGRFYDPQQGRILIDGVDIRDIDLVSLRAQVVFVFQETYLFSDTVEANIAYGRPGIAPGQVEAASRLAQAHEFIEVLPDRYNAILGERGSSLSGGQKQRLAIARAVVSDPRILILDDATAAVDPETEDLIRKAMRFVMHERTMFIIAHRISTVKSADMVIVLEKGRITQVGTHEELLEQPGHYRDIAEVQLYGDSSEERESNRVGEWESGRVGERENGQGCDAGMPTPWPTSSEVGER